MAVLNPTGGHTPSENIAFSIISEGVKSIREIRKRKSKSRGEYVNKILLVRGVTSRVTLSKIYLSPGNSIKNVTLRPKKNVGFPLTEAKKIGAVGRDFFFFFFNIEIQM